MTSGTFVSLPISSITVNRDKRQRKELTKIEELAASIAKVGLINPIVVTPEYELVAGERRLTAVQSLGHTHVACQFTTDLDELALHEIELEENVKRVDLPWQDECKAIEDYHKFKASSNEAWTMNDTADALNIARTKVGQAIAIAKELASGNERVIEAPKFSTARGIVERAAERKRTSTLNTIAAVVEDKEPAAPTVPVLNTSFIDWYQSYTGPQFNFIHCDFPYGVNADKHAQGAASELGGYEDSFSVYTALLDALENAMPKLVAESAHIMFWFSMDFYQLTFDRLTKMGWRINPFPLIWHKSDNSGILPDPQRGPRRIYETCFFGSLGDRKIVRSVSNVVAAPVTKEIHMSEKSLPMLTKFMEMFVDEHTVMLDPTCGSGNSLKAALKHRAHSVLGLEINKEFYDRTIETFYGDEE